MSMRDFLSGREVDESDVAQAIEREETMVDALEDRRSCDWDHGFNPFVENGLGGWHGGFRDDEGSL